MSKKTKILLIAVLVVVLAIIALVSCVVFTANADEGTESPVQLFIGDASNIVESGTITNQKFGVVVNETAFIYIRTPKGQLDNHNVTDSKLLNYTDNGIYTIEKLVFASNLSNPIALNVKIVLDNIAPNIFIESNSAILSNGTIVNVETIAFNVDDATVTNYVFRTSTNSTTEIPNGAIFSDEETYTFYSIDLAGNKSDELTITIDRTAPVGNFYADGVLTASLFVNAEKICYTASDKNDFKVYVKKLSDNNFALTENSKIFTTEGSYSFYVEDAAGNQSAIQTITIDRVKPTLAVYANSEQISLDTLYSTASVLQFFGNDINLAECLIKLPNTSNFISTTSGVVYSAEGKYEFYAKDFAGNKSETFIIILDRTSPTGAVFAKGSEIENGFINSPFVYVGTDNASGIAYMEIKKPASSEWEIYSGTEITGANGVYYFRSCDNVGFVSSETSVVYDTVSPEVKVNSAETELHNLSFTNSGFIVFTATDLHFENCFVKLPNSSEFVTCNSGEQFSVVGKYEFFAIDKAGNASAIYTATIDRTPKAVNALNVADGKTLQDVILSWENTPTLAPIVSVTVNGISVENNITIKTVNKGTYEIISLDSAGNSWGFEFTASRTDIETATVNKFWWEAKDLSGKSYSFESYEKALAFAQQREQSLVKTMTWGSATWDTGYIMDSVDSVNAKQGTFYLYKKHDNPNIEVAYFTLERLKEVIKQYAEKGIAKYYYWEKSPATIQDGNDLYSLTTDGTVIATSIKLRADLAYKIDGVASSGTSFNVSGKHIFTVFDDFGNSIEYNVFIVSVAPELEYKFASGSYYKSSTEQPYYLKNQITIRVADSLDQLAVALVKNSQGNVLYIVGINEELTITEAGKYIIQTINHFGSKEYVFYISFNNPTVSATDNTTTKRLEITVSPSVDKDITLLNVQIYKSLDGKNWTLLLVDDYDLTINLNNLKYSFYKTGYYKIVVEDICRSGIDAVVFETIYEKPEPTGNLNGVESGGYTNGSVSFTWKDEAFVNLLVNGIETEYSSGTVLTEEGSYRLVFRDLNGYEKEYTFVIDKTPAEIVTSEEILNGYVANSLSISWDKEAIATLYFNGVLTEYEKNNELSENGKYRLEVIDLAGNKAVVEFVIDGTAPTVELQGVENGGKTSDKVTLKNLSETATIQAYFNGTEFNYSIGTSLSEIGKYRFVITDLAGNVSEYEFEIVYSLNSAGVIIIVILSIAVVAGVVIFLVKKKIIRLDFLSKKKKS